MLHPQIQLHGSCFRWTSKQVKSGAQAVSRLHTPENVEADTPHIKTLHLKQGNGDPEIHCYLLPVSELDLAG